MLEVKHTHAARRLTVEALHGNMVDTHGAEYLLRIDGDMLLLTSQQLEHIIKDLEKVLHGA